MEPTCTTITEDDFTVIRQSVKFKGKYFLSKKAIIDAKYDSYKSFECESEEEARTFRKNVQKWGSRAGYSLNFKISGRKVLIHKKPI